MKWSGLQTSYHEWWIRYLAKIFRLGLEEPGGEGAGVGPDFDGVVGVAQAPLDAVDDEVRVELRGLIQHSEIMLYLHA